MTLPLTPLWILGINLSLILCSSTAVLGAPIAKESPNGTSMHIIDDGGGTNAIKVILPLHHSANMRYFAAGVGMLERATTYPVFPLKIVFSQTDGAYLSLIAMTVWAEDGKAVWQIPGSHVKGPWVFLDLPAGIYRIDVFRGADHQSRSQVEVHTGRQGTISFTWPS